MSAYLLIHLYYTVPVALLLHCILKPMRNRRDVVKLLLLICIAVIYTTPFDSFLIRSKIWSYEKNSVVATVWSIPLEEYLFFAIQTYITASLYSILSKPIFFPLYVNLSTRTGFLAWTIALAPTVLGALLVNSPPKYTYLGWTLLWSGPILAFQFLFAYSFLQVIPPYLFCGTVFLPTVYLWIVDNIALHKGVWRIEEGTKMNYQIFGMLDIEEAVFFLLTNTMICLGLLGCDKAFVVMDVFPDASSSSWDIFQKRGLFSKPSSSDCAYLQNIMEASRILEEKSKSFHFASMIFSNRCRSSLVAIYAVCRVMDDSVDNTANALFAGEYLADVKSYLNIIASNPSEQCAMPNVVAPGSRLAFTLLPNILQYIPVNIFLRLIQGFEADLHFFKATDISQFPIQTETSLIQYCECVASTVAQMFVHAIWNAEGTRPAKPHQQNWILERASDMGIALQLVNIARDIAQDACNGRLYIPLEWADSSEARTELVELMNNPRDPLALSAIKKYSVRLVQMARSYYYQAEQALLCLPPEYVKGARLTLDVYMAIGEKILERHGDVSERVSLSMNEKIRIAAKVLYDL